MQPVGGVLELDELEQRLRALLRLGGGQREQPALEHQQLAPGLARVEPRLLQRDADPLARPVGVLRDVDARHLRPARRDRQQRREHAHGRGLAGAVRPEESEDLAGLDAQVDAPHRLDIVVVFDQSLGFDRSVHRTGQPTR